MHRQREFRAYMKAANQTPGRRDSRHLSEAEMIAYCRGEMPATKREAAQAHLVACESCVALLRDVSVFLGARANGNSAGCENERRSCRRPRLTRLEVFFLIGAPHGGDRR